MSKVTITIDTDSPAFDGGPILRDLKVARTLRDLAQRIESGEGGCGYIPLMDINGNKVGEFNDG